MDEENKEEEKVNDGKHCWREEEVEAEVVNKED